MTINVNNETIIVPDDADISIIDDILYVDSVPWSDTVEGDVDVQKNQMAIVQCPVCGTFRNPLNEEECTHENLL